MIAIAAPAASAQAWSCDAFGYLFQTQAGAASSDIVQVDLATGAQNPAGIVGTPPPGGKAVVNAVAYNSVDNYFYANMATYPVAGVPAFTSSIVRVHPDGSVDDLGVPTGPGGAVDPTSGYHIGDIDPDGHYWMSNGVVWYEIDLTTATPTVLRSGTLTQEGPGTGIADWAWTNGALYSISNTSAGVPARLVKFNPTTGVLEDVGPVGFDTGGVGAVFVDSSGYLYASRNANNNIYRVDTTTRQTILASEGTGSSPGNDGARCALAPVPTITVAKTVAGRVRPADQFTVGLLRPDGSAATSATTSGTATTASTVNFPASQGKTYTITEAMAPGSPTPLSEYATSISCLDAGGSAVSTGGSVGSWTLNVSEATSYTCTVTNAAGADLELVKSATPTPAVPGTAETYSLTVTNHGPSTASNVTVSDKLPQALTFSSASPGCAEAGGTVTCSLPELAPGAAHTFTIETTIASSAEDCDDVRNTATVTSTTADGNPANNTAAYCPPVEGRTGVKMAKVASRPVVPSGGQVMYTLLVENDGPSDASETKVSDTLPAGLALVSAKPAQGRCTTSGNTVSCDLGRLAAGGSTQVLVTATVTATGGCLVNSATVSGDLHDSDTADNTATSQICVTPPRVVVPSPPAADPKFDLVVKKTTSHKAAYVGQRVAYKITVTNNGPAAATDAQVNDTLNRPVKVVSVRASQGSCDRSMPVSCRLGTIAPGATATIRVTIRHKEAARGQRNAASATADGTDGNPADNLDRVDKRVKKVRLRVTKVASGRTVQAGDRFSYRIRVHNRTRGVARRVKVCDRLPSGLRYRSSKPRAKRHGRQRCWTIKRLKARKTRTFRINVQTAQGANGRKTNRVTATSPDARRARAKATVAVRGVATPVTG